MPDSIPLAFYSNNGLGSTINHLKNVPNSKLGPTLNALKQGDSTT